METTLFLAKLWGPAILAVGIGVFFSRSYYIKIYRDLEKSVSVVTSQEIVETGIKEIDFFRDQIRAFYALVNVY